MAILGGKRKKENTMENILALKQKYVEARGRGSGYHETGEQLLSRQDAEIAAIRQKYQDENADFFRDYKAANEELLSAEAALREALTTWGETSDTATFDENLSVRVSVALKYETSKAVEWAKIKAPFLIEKSINKKKFELIAMGLDFVEVKKITTAVIKGL